MGQIIFLGWINEHLTIPPKAFIMFLPITLIAIRLGTRATTLTLNIIAIQALLGVHLKKAILPMKSPLAICTIIGFM